MNHLNQDKLIQYAFDLMEPQDRQAAQKHLDECGDCRKILAETQAKFAAMDVLSNEFQPSEELIEQTLAAKNSVKNIPLYRRRSAQWFMAAAAVALACLVLFRDLPSTRTNEPPSKVPGPVATLDTPQPIDDLKFVGDAYVEVAEKPVDTLGIEAGVSNQLTRSVRVVNEDEIPDKAPFTPASAIELVVLPKTDKSQVTIYNSKDLTLVRDTRKLTLKPGWNWLQFMWDNTQIDPTSLLLTPLEYTDKVEIELISYPARLKDIGRWLIRSEVEGAVPFELTYFASGLNWQAFYMGTMNEDETTMDLKGYVNVSNHSGQDFENTQTRLIVGETRLTEEISYLAQRHYPYGPDVTIEDEEGIKDGYNGRKYDWYFENKKVPLLGDMPMLGTPLFAIDGDFDMSGGISLRYDIKQIEKTGLSEYFLYTIEGTEDLKNQWTKRLPSLDVTDIPVKSLYKYDDDRYGKQAVRFVSFTNDTDHELGETPIPEGYIKIYRNVNEQQNLSYVGQSNVKYIPVNEDIELNLGPARLVKVEPVLTKTQTENYTFSSKGNINGWDDIESYKVTITNTRDIPIDIELTWNMGTDAWELDLESSPPAKGEYPEGGRGFDFEYKKHDKNRARFTLTVPARSEEAFEHTIRKYREKRIEAYVQKQKEQQR